MLFTILALMLTTSIASADRGRRWRDHGDRRATPTWQHGVHPTRREYRSHHVDYRTFRRPVIHQRYVDYRYRPRLIVETYDPYPGYIWVRGHVPDPAYAYPYDEYGDGYYRYDGY